jgi:hypothetical protein
VLGTIAANAVPSILDQAILTYPKVIIRPTMSLPIVFNQFSNAFSSFDINSMSLSPNLSQNTRSYNGLNFVYDSNDGVYYIIDKTTSVFVSASVPGFNNSYTDYANDLNQPTGIVFHRGSYFAYIINDNNIIRINCINGSKTTIASTVQTVGALRLTGVTKLTGIAINTAGNKLYIVDNNLRILECILDTSTYNLTSFSVIAGATTAGYVDGPGGTSMFKHITDIVVDSVYNNILVADRGNNAIRLVDSNKYVTTHTYSGIIGSNIRFTDINGSVASTHSYGYNTGNTSSSFTGIISLSIYLNMILCIVDGGLTNGFFILRIPYTNIYRPIEDSDVEDTDVSQTISTITSGTLFVSGTTPEYESSALSGDTDTALDSIVVANNLNTKIRVFNNSLVLYNSVRMGFDYIYPTTSALYYTPYAKYMYNNNIDFCYDANYSKYYIIDTVTSSLYSTSNPNNSDKKKLLFNLNGVSSIVCDSKSVLYAIDDRNIFAFYGGAEAKVKTIVASIDRNICNITLRGIVKLTGIAINNTGDKLYVVDTNVRIIEINLTDLTFNIFAGEIFTPKQISESGIILDMAAVKGYKDGRNASAKFNHICDICCTPDGSIIVADRGNNAIRHINKYGFVTTYVSSNNDVEGRIYTNGSGPVTSNNLYLYNSGTNSSSFKNIRSLCVVNNNIYCVLTGGISFGFFIQCFPYSITPAQSNMGSDITMTTTTLFDSRLNLNGNMFSVYSFTPGIDGSSYFWLRNYSQNVSRIIRMDRFRNFHYDIPTLWFMTPIVVHPTTGVIYYVDNQSKTLCSINGRTHSQISGQLSYFIANDGQGYVNGEWNRTLPRYAPVAFTRSIDYDSETNSLYMISRREPNYFHLDMNYIHRYDIDTGRLSLSVDTCVNYGCSNRAEDFKVDIRQANNHMGVTATFTVAKMCKNKNIMFILTGDNRIVFIDIIKKSWGYIFNHYTDDRGRLEGTHTALGDNVRDMCIDKNTNNLIILNGNSVLIVKPNQSNYDYNGQDFIVIYYIYGSDWMSFLRILPDGAVSAIPSFTMNLWNSDPGPADLGGGNLIYLKDNMLHIITNGGTSYMIYPYNPGVKLLRIKSTNSYPDKYFALHDNNPFPPQETSSNSWITSHISSGIFTILPSTSPMPPTLQTPLLTDSFLTNIRYHSSNVYNNDEYIAYDKMANSLYFSSSATTMTSFVKPAIDIVVDTLNYNIVYALCEDNLIYTNGATRLNTITPPNNSKKMCIHSSFIFIMTEASIVRFNITSGSSLNIASITNTGVLHLNDVTSLTGIAVNTTGDKLYVIDNNVRVLEINLTANTFRVIAGGTTVGYIDGPGASARFNNISDICCTSDNNILIADRGNHSIRFIDTVYNVTTYTIGNLYRNNLYEFNPPSNTQITFTYGHIIPKKINTILNLSKNAKYMTNGSSLNTQFNTIGGKWLTTSTVDVSSICYNPDNNNIYCLTCAGTQLLVFPYYGNGVQNTEIDAYEIIAASAIVSEQNVSSITTISTINTDGTQQGGATLGKGASSTQYQEYLDLYKYINVDGVPTGGAIGGDASSSQTSIVRINLNATYDITGIQYLKKNIETSSVGMKLRILDSSFNKVGDDKEIYVNTNNQLFDYRNPSLTAQQKNSTQISIIPTRYGVCGTMGRYVKLSKANNNSQSWYKFAISQLCVIIPDGTNVALGKSAKVSVSNGNYVTISNIVNGRYMSLPTADSYVHDTVNINFLNSDHIIIDLGTEYDIAAVNIYYCSDVKETNEGLVTIYTEDKLIAQTKTTANKNDGKEILEFRFQGAPPCYTSVKWDSNYGIAGFKARYIRLQKTGQISFSKLEVIDKTGFDIAENRTVSVVSGELTKRNGVSYITGVRLQRYGYSSLNTPSAVQSYTVDFGAVKEICNIRIYGCSDVDHLKDMEIYLFSSLTDTPFKIGIINGNEKVQSVDTRYEPVNSIYPTKVLKTVTRKGSFGVHANKVYIYNLDVGYGIGYIITDANGLMISPESRRIDGDHVIFTLSRMYEITSVAISVSLDVTVELYDCHDARVGVSVTNLKYSGYRYADFRNYWNGIPHIYAPIKPYTLRRGPNSVGVMARYIKIVCRDAKTPLYISQILAINEMGINCARDKQTYHSSENPAFPTNAKYALDGVYEATFDNPEFLSLFYTKYKRKPSTNSYVSYVDNKNIHFFAIDLGVEQPINSIIYVATNEMEDKANGVTVILLDNELKVVGSQVVTRMVNIFGIDILDFRVNTAADFSLVPQRIEVRERIVQIGPKECGILTQYVRIQQTNETYPVKLSQVIVTDTNGVNVAMYKPTYASSGQGMSYSIVDARYINKPSNEAFVSDVGYNQFVEINLGNEYEITSVQVIDIVEYNPGFNTLNIRLFNKDYDVIGSYKLFIDKRIAEVLNSITPASDTIESISLNTNNFVYLEKVGVQIGDSLISTKYSEGIIANSPINNISTISAVPQSIQEPLGGSCTSDLSLSQRYTRVNGGIPTRYIRVYNVDNYIQVGQIIALNNLYENVSVNKPASATSFLPDQFPAYAVDGWGTGIGFRGLTRDSKNCFISGKNKYDYLEIDLTRYENIVAVGYIPSSSYPSRNIGTRIQLLNEDRIIISESVVNNTDNIYVDFRNRYNRTIPINTLIGAPITGRTPHTDGGFFFVNIYSGYNTVIRRDYYGANQVFYTYRPYITTGRYAGEKGLAWDFFAGGARCYGVCYDWDKRLLYSATSRGLYISRYDSVRSEHWDYGDQRPFTGGSNSSPSISFPVCGVAVGTYAPSLRQYNDVYVIEPGANGRLIRYPRSYHLAAYGVDQNHKYIVLLHANNMHSILYNIYTFDIYISLISLKCIIKVTQPKTPETLPGTVREGHSDIIVFDPTKLIETGTNGVIVTVYAGPSRIASNYPYPLDPNFIEMPLEGPAGMQQREFYLFVADSVGNKIYLINLSNHKYTPIAGTGIAGLGDDGTTATQCRLNRPEYLFIPHNDNILYIGDTGNGIIRTINIGALIPNIKAISSTSTLPELFTTTTIPGTATGIPDIPDTIKRDISIDDEIINQVPSYLESSLMVEPNIDVISIIEDDPDCNIFLYRRNDGNIIRCKENTNRGLDVINVFGNMSSIFKDIEVYSMIGVSTTESTIFYLSINKYIYKYIVGAPNPLYHLIGNESSDYTYDGTIDIETTSINPYGLSWNKLNNMLYFSECYTNCGLIRRLNTTNGIFELETIVGIYSDQATQTEVVGYYNFTSKLSKARSNPLGVHLLKPYCITHDQLGNLYIADYGTHSIHRLTPGGWLEPICGPFKIGSRTDFLHEYAVDTKYPAFNVKICEPKSMVIDCYMNLICTSHSGCQIYRISNLNDLEPRVEVIAGLGFISGNKGIVSGSPKYLTLSNIKNITYSAVFHKFYLTQKNDTNNCYIGSMTNEINQVTYRSSTNIMNYSYVKSLNVDSNIRYRNFCFNLYGEMFYMLNSTIKKVLVSNTTIDLVSDAYNDTPFAIYNNSIIYINNTNKLVRYNTELNTTTILNTGFSDNIKSMCIHDNGYLFFNNLNTVYYINIKLSSPSISSILGTYKYGAISIDSTNNYLYITRSKTIHETNIRCVDKHSIGFIGSTLQLSIPVNTWTVSDLNINTITTHLSNTYIAVDKFIYKLLSNNSYELILGTDSTNQHSMPVSSTMVKLYNVYAIRFKNDGSLFVSDRGTLNIGDDSKKRILELKPFEILESDKVYTVAGSPINDNTKNNSNNTSALNINLNNPVATACDKDGCIHIVDNRRVIKIDKLTGNVIVVATTAYEIIDIQITKSGIIYILSPNVLYSITQAESGSYNIPVPVTKEWDGVNRGGHVNEDIAMYAGVRSSTYQLEHARTMRFDKSDNLYIVSSRPVSAILNKIVSDRVNSSTDNAYNSACTALYGTTTVNNQAIYPPYLGGAIKADYDKNTSLYGANATEESPLSGSLKYNDNIAQINIDSALFFREQLNVVKEMNIDSLKLKWNSIRTTASPFINNSSISYIMTNPLDDYDTNEERSFKLTIAKKGWSDCIISLLAIFNDIEYINMTIYNYVKTNINKNEFLYLNEYFTNSSYGDGRFPNGISTFIDRLRKFSIEIPSYYRSATVFTSISTYIEQYLDGINQYFNTTNTKYIITVLDSAYTASLTSYNTALTARYGNTIISLDNPAGGTRKAYNDALTARYGNTIISLDNPAGGTRKAYNDALFTYNQINNSRISNLASATPTAAERSQVETDPKNISRFFKIDTRNYIKEHGTIGWWTNRPGDTVDPTGHHINGKQLHLYNLIECTGIAFDSYNRMALVDHYTKQGFYTVSIDYDYGPQIGNVDLQPINLFIAEGGSFNLNGGLSYDKSLINSFLNLSPRYEREITTVAALIDPTFTMDTSIENFLERHTTILNYIKTYFDPVLNANTTAYFPNSPTSVKSPVIEPPITYRNHPNIYTKDVIYDYTPPPISKVPYGVAFDNEDNLYVSFNKSDIQYNSNNIKGGFIAIFRKGSRDYIGNTSGIEPTIEELTYYGTTHYRNVKLKDPGLLTIDSLNRIILTQSGYNSVLMINSISNNFTPYRYIRNYVKHTYTDLGIITMNPYYDWHIITPVVALNSFIGIRNVRSIYIESSILGRGITLKKIVIDTGDTDNITIDSQNFSSSLYVLYTRESFNNNQLITTNIFPYTSLSSVLDPYIVIQFGISATSTKNIKSITLYADSSKTQAVGMNVVLTSIDNKVMSNRKTTHHILSTNGCRINYDSTISYS